MARGVNLIHIFKNSIFCEFSDVSTVASKKLWSSMLFQNLVRLSQIKKNSLPDYAHVNKVSKKIRKK
jgi:hypothetical protein